jgi:hypothetical protein
MCNKTEFMRKAIDMNLYNSTNYIWIDFGIFHIIKSIGEESIAKQAILNMKYKCYDKIRTPIGIYWDFYIDSFDPLCNAVSWVFLGGIIGGNKDNLIYFADKVRDKCWDLINNKNTLLWEVNIWHILYKDEINRDLFSTYVSGHDINMINDY